MCLFYSYLHYLSWMHTNWPVFFIASVLIPWSGVPAAILIFLVFTSSIQNLLLLTALDSLLWLTMKYQHHYCSWHWRYVAVMSTWVSHSHGCVVNDSYILGHHPWIYFCFAGNSVQSECSCIELFFLLHFITVESQETQPCYSGTFTFLRQHLGLSGYVLTKAAVLL